MLLLLLSMIKYMVQAPCQNFTDSTLLDSELCIANGRHLIVLEELQGFHPMQDLFLKALPNGCDNINTNFFRCKSIEEFDKKRVGPFD